MDAAGQANLRITSASHLEDTPLYAQKSLTMCSYCCRWPLQARCVPYVYHSQHKVTCHLHMLCRLPGSLCRGHDQRRADAHHERDQEDVESLLERELRHVRHTSISAPRDGQTLILGAGESTRRAFLRFRSLTRRSSRRRTRAF
jgi:hypothetical protein